ncbi:Uncharacterized protein APZ42_024934 [Daphnia magna]|uniref:Uncharacterized protein n=1 Tax=Daphnia magna TaxID=35525 RepID=A0A164TPP8_9CRUS|nr:Uncharacterized protein APZ42_024934 [Daphnia magna]
MFRYCTHTHTHTHFWNGICSRWQIQKIKIENKIKERKRTCRFH